MIEVIKSKNESCTGCNRCVRECPMEMAGVTYQDENGNIKVKIDPEKCVACGRCVSACKHEARHFTDDTERFFNDLSRGVPISVIAAPAIRTNIPEYKRLFTYLKQIGVKKIYDVSLGADICIWAHIRHMDRNGVSPLITQPCPAIVTYCEKYRHDLLPRLSPVHSPMACAAVYMKEYQGITDRIAAISPCIAKSNEFLATGLADYNITFTKLLDHLAENAVALPEEETRFDHDESGLGSLFPMPGGLKENIEYFLGKKLHIGKAEGYVVYERLNQYAATPEEFLPDIYDVLSCTEGCNIGSAYSHDRSIFEIEKTMSNNRRKATAERNREHFEAVYRDYDEMFDISHFLRDYKPVHTAFPKITNEDIRIAFESLGKADFEKQHIDCGACGSNTCLGMARKIALKVNITENCIFKSKEDAKTEHEENLLAHAQLAATEMQRREAEAASSAKSSFLSTMSHEIRTPMNAIIGMTAIGKLTNDIGKKDDAFKKIESASKHLLGIINDILDISKIEANKFDVSPVSFEFEKMLQKVADVVNLRVDERHQRFYVTIDNDIPKALIGDDQRLSQVIANLLSNAVKFTPEEGTIRLDSKLLSEEDGMCCLQISIEDTGIGISDEQKTRLFNSFEQAEAGTTRKFGGTGLGLAISKRIVDLMGGDIWVESELGKGSKFVFTVVMKRDESHKDRQLEDDVDWSNIRVFVVDDEPEIREFFKAVTNSLGIDSTVVASGEEAVKLLESDHDFDVYFIDWKLPGMNGVELAGKIKRKMEQKSIVTIFSSADWAVIEDDARAAGVSKFLPKPLFPSVIVDAITEYIDFDRKNDKVIETAGCYDFSRYSVLLVEDVEINREILLALLEPTNLTADCAENGAVAVEMFTANPDKYDMVLMDIQMPIMDGYEATQRIRALGVPNASAVPIVAMTANVFREDVERCMEAGMNGHVGKPLDLNEVFRQLRCYLSARPTRKAAN